MQTSKKITLWALVVYTVVALVEVLAHWTGHSVPAGLLPSIEKIVMVIVTAYMGKAGVENFAKIKSNPTNGSN